MVYLAIGDRILCDATCSAIPPKTPEQNAIPRSLQSSFAVTGLSWWAERGYSSDSSRYAEKHSATGALLHLCRDGGSNLVWNTKTVGSLRATRLQNKTAPEQI